MLKMRTREELIALVRSGIQVKYLFFWGHTPKEAGVVDKSCFSNWFPAPFLEQEVEFATTEHYMMAKKALLFKDEEAYRTILEAESPGEAKKLGRTVRGFDDEVWKKHRFEIVVAGNYAKFSRNAELKQVLLQTGTKVLVEASPRDCIWGIGLSGSNPVATDPEKWRGLNLLGFALMEVRERLLTAD